MEIVCPCVAFIVKVLVGTQARPSGEFTLSASLNDTMPELPNAHH